MYIATQIIGGLIVLSTLWMCFEMWRAPLLEEQLDGSWKTIKPAKTLKSLFKRKNK